MWPIPRELVNSELPLLPNRSRKNVSSASFLLSPLASIVMVFVVSQGLKVSVPVPATSSSLLVPVLPFTAATASPPRVSGQVVPVERQTCAGSSLAGTRLPPESAVRATAARRRSLQRRSGTPKTQ